jgi:hypothetical protein
MMMGLLRVSVVCLIVAVDRLPSQSFTLIWYENSAVSIDGVVDARDSCVLGGDVTHPANKRIPKVTQRRVTDLMRMAVMGVAFQFAKELE